VTEVIGEICPDCTNTVKKYGNTEIHELKTKRIFKKGNSAYYVYREQLFLFFSYSNILLERAIRQIDQPGSIKQSDGFRIVRKTAGHNVDANLYVQFRTFSQACFSIIWW